MSFCFEIRVVEIALGVDMSLAGLVDVPEDYQISFDRVDGGSSCSLTSNVDPMLPCWPLASRRTAWYNSTCLIWS